MLFAMACAGFTVSLERSGPLEDDASCTVTLPRLIRFAGHAVPAWLMDCKVSTFPPVDTMLTPEKTGESYTLLTEVPLSVPSSATRAESEEPCRIFHLPWEFFALFNRGGARYQDILPERALE